MAAMEMQEQSKMWKVEGENYGKELKFHIPHIEHLIQWKIAVKRLKFNYREKWCDDWFDWFQY